MLIGVICLRGCKERIRKYGFAFCGKKVLIGQEMKAEL